MITPIARFIPKHLECDPGNFSAPSMHSRKVLTSSYEMPTSHKSKSRSGNNQEKKFCQDAFYVSGWNGAIYNFKDNSQ